MSTGSTGDARCSSPKAKGIDPESVGLAGAGLTTVEAATSLLSAAILWRTESDNLDAVASVPADAWPSEELAAVAAAITAPHQRGEEVEAWVIMTGFWRQGKGHLVSPSFLGRLCHTHSTCRPQACADAIRLAHAQWELQAKAETAARMSAVPVESVPPTTWHAAVLGITKGRDALKAAAQREAQEVTGWDDLTEHESDATCLAICGRRTTYGGLRDG